MPELQNVETMKYEEAFAELEAIVNSLESEEHLLEDSLQLFARGQQLAKHCARLLDEAELRVKQLSGEEQIDFSTQ